MISRSEILISLRVTLFSTLASLVATAFLMQALNGGQSWLAFTIAFLVPLVITFPTTLYIQRQHANIARMHEELQEAHRNLKHISQFDDLTKILNRATFCRYTEERFEAGMPIHIFAIDADHFKKVNDEFGHIRGDEALVSMAKAIRSASRSTDFVGRMGGEEFCVCSVGVSAKEAQRIAERIRKAVESAVFEPVPGLRHPLTVSIGLARSRPGLSLDGVFNLADQAMYKAKQSGRNCVVVDETANQVAA